MNRQAKLLILPLLVVQILWFIFAANHRFAHVDEGFYLLASRLVAAHKSLYGDFFFQQAPLLPYVYAAWIKMFGTSWIAARMLSSILAAVLGILIYIHVTLDTGEYLIGLVGTLLFACSTLIFAFYITATPYALTGSLLFSAYFLATWIDKRRYYSLLASGVLLALAISARSYVIIIGPVFLWWIIKHLQSESRRESVLFIIGLSIGSIPSMYFFARSPQVFLFDNLGYHAMRTDAGLVGLWSQKAEVVFQLLFGNGVTNGIQWSLLVLLCGGLWISGTLEPRSRFAVVIASALAMVSLMPTPAFPQYFSLCVPFMIVGAVCGATQLNGRSRSNKSLARVLVMKGLSTFLIVVYISSAIASVRLYLLPNANQFGLKGDWSLQRIDQVSGAIDEIAMPGEVVASFWPGDIFATTANPFPGLEDDEGLRVADRLTSRDRDMYHITSRIELETTFASHYPRIVVVRKAPEGGELYVRRGAYFGPILERDGYSVYKSLGGVSIYVWTPRP